MSHSIKDLSELDNKLEEAGQNLVVVDFYAPWCGPCKKMEPKYEEYAAAYPDVVFLKVDVDECDDIVEHFEISVMPTFVFYKNKNKIEVFAGGNEEKLKEVILNLK